MLELLLLAAPPAPHSPNLWGALGCSVGFAGALFTTLDALGDFVELRSSNPTLRLGQRLKYSGKLSGAGITVVSAGTVLALDSNWFALVALSVVFTVVVVVSWLLARRVRRSTAAVGESVPLGASMPTASASPASP
ncbi:hypothetical protein [uncultured Amnibacterium sp.]|uniref:hypothetical protein n=1 Tax=uncultured Amnibacterium sp. TaxID=1631851 RepID=UPI0035CB39BF